ncbi:MAG: class I SAM-dependent methyltransferase [Carboxylicivirga sp.]|nr:class I SAM-dependent methyltransferase [Carboxylicivirga sp.]
MNFFQIRSYINYILKAKHAKGYGLHSPFVFNLVREVFYSKHSYYAFDAIMEIRKELVQSDQEIQMTDYGAGSTTFNNKQRKVSDLVRKSSISPKYGELLFCLIQSAKPESVLELGTSIGISTLYFALSDKGRPVLSIEGCSETANVAKAMFNKAKCDNIEQVVGNFRDVLPGIVAQYDHLDFVFFDGNHQKQATLDYFNTCLSKVRNETVFVFDDIHWSKGMSEAWDIICKHPQVTVSVDLFQLGILFFKRECQKQHFIVRY